MKKSTKVTTLTTSEFDYIQACWNQISFQSYPDFFDYLCLNIGWKQKGLSIY